MTVAAATGGATRVGIRHDRHPRGVNSLAAIAPASRPVGAGFQAFSKEEVPGMGNSEFNSDFLDQPAAAPWLIFTGSAMFAFVMAGISALVRA